ncbi:catalase family protein [Phenylobacterium deserti]|uniref:Catalase n=1 Tax=Phenylobacterium deserti TaxID=1914756 RepID=A0A328APX8_9CAUL|nr:catalase family protein [Phenylobacterium deserti]RAK57050.1 catalase [Phenylobacterium deserti]
MDPHRLPQVLDWRDAPHGLAPPLLFHPDLEQIGKHEGQLARALSDVVQEIARQTWERRGQAFRGVHAKSLGLIAGRLNVRPDLPPWLAQGLFAFPGEHPCLMRVSSLAGDILPEAVSLPRGCAIKVLDVHGPRLAGAPEAGSQDFVLANSRTFNGRNARLFLWALRRLSRVAERGAGAKILASHLTRRAEKLLERFGRESPELKAVGGQPLTHPLGDAFHSQLPIRFGDHAAKFALVPASPELRGLWDAPVADSDREDAVREAISRTMQRCGGAWSLAVQLCRDLRSNPIEDGADDWDEASSPFFEVAELQVGPQAAWDEQHSPELDARIGFSPWNGLEAHRPLGALMRLRQLSYSESCGARGQRNAVDVQAPAKLDLERLTLRR